MKRLFDNRWRLALFRRLAPWIAKLSSPCSGMARLASESCERKLTWWERWRMRWHYVVCDWCRRYTQQLNELHRLAPLVVSKAPQLHRRAMPEETRERLKRTLLAGGRE